MKENKKNDRPLLIRLWEYQKERAPLIVMIVISAIMVGLVYNFSDASLLRYFIAVTILVLYLIQIRVSDEKKDFEFDNKFHRNRPVQRGLVTLDELYKVNKVAIISQLILYASFLDIRIFILGLLSQGYAFLTRKEFFIREWLREHYFTYNFTHYIQLVVLYYALINIIQPTGISYAQILLYAAINVAVLEFGRKIMPKEDDIAGDTYSANLGYKNTAIGLALVSMFVAVFSYLLISKSILYMIIPIAVLGWVINSAYHYGTNPNKTNTKYMEASSLLMVVVSVLSVIIGT